MKMADAKKTNALAEEEGIPSSIDIFIPVEIVEGILSRLPVKSLIRFQSACKLWRTIISDRRFRRIHYDTTRKTNRYWMRPFYSVDSDRLVKFDNKEFKTEWLLESPFVYVFLTPKRTCDGVVLMVNDATRLMALWNPSVRKHYCYIDIPPELGDDVRTYGFYYDPITDDYRIAVISPLYYAIYSCRSAGWSETKPFPPALPARREEGFNVNGSSSFYWPDMKLGEILCFDFRDEELSWLPLPDLGAYQFYLTAMSGRLCLLGQKQRRSGLMKSRLWLMVERNRSWIELIIAEKGGRQRRIAAPYVSTNEDTVVLSLERTGARFTTLFICNLRDGSLEEFKADVGIGIKHMLPYSESLNFPVPEIVL